MSTVQSREILLKEVERRLRTLSIERLQVARDFLAYLEERESAEATEELLRMSGFEEALAQALRQAEKGEIVRFEDVRRN
ncbi:MAG: hypothetical protein ACK4WK_04620 [Anaerolineae bacterium]